ncbi:4218_t:CDS:1 [Funneliformis caledonium]|uniref:4218_t:CDS:1 n=1 Tax=Funneliformis caledonium TaxID=1117310 RepID=A0A9N9G1F2_9GLOM|nr:4218_t:CDS:1 [Funneliformis caledonium]
MFSQLASKRNSLTIINLFLRHESTLYSHNTNKKSSTFIPGKQGYDVKKFSPPPPPKKSNKKKAKLAAKLKDKTAQTQGAENPTTEQTTSIKELDLTIPKKEENVQQYKEESIKEFDLAIPKNEEELELRRRKEEWHDKIKQERRDKLNKIHETIKILSLSSDPNEFCTPEYRARKRENALINYHKRESEKRRERRINLLTLYYNSSDFVTLNNLDTKIADMYNDVRQPFTTTLEDMQIDYQEGGGIIDDLELKRRLDKIKDTLSGTAQGGKKKLGLDKIEKLQEMSETNRVEPLGSSIETEPNLVQSESLDS